MRHAADLVPRIILILENDAEFEEIISEPVRDGHELNAKYAKLRAYLEERLGGNPLQEIPREAVSAVPKLYRHLLKYGEVIRPIPRCESRKISAIPAMVAEVLIDFIDFRIQPK